MLLRAQPAAREAPLPRVQGLCPCRGPGRSPALVAAARPRCEVSAFSTSASSSPRALPGALETLSTDRIFKSFAVDGFWMRQSVIE